MLPAMVVADVLLMALFSWSFSYYMVRYRRVDVYKYLVLIPFLYALVVSFLPGFQYYVSSSVMFLGLLVSYVTVRCTYYPIIGEGYGIYDEVQVFRKVS